MDYSNRDSKRSRARDRVAARQQRRQPMAVRRTEAAERADQRADNSEERRARSSPRLEMPSLPQIPSLSPRLGDAGGRLSLMAQEFWWQFTHTPTALYVVGSVVALAALIFVLSHLLGGRIFPNVYAMGVDLGGLTVEEATAKLDNLWQRTLRLTLEDGDRTWQTTPADLGLSFDAQATAESARGVGMSGIPFGYAVVPRVGVNDELKAQTFLLDLSQQANVAASNPGFRWVGEELTTVPAREGKMLDVAATLGALMDAPAQVAERARLALVMQPVRPDAQEADVALEAARALTSQTFQMSGYDPFTNETITWSTDRDTFTSWIEASGDGLALREAAFRPFLDAQAATLNPDPSGLRFIEPTDAVERVRAAISSGVAQIGLRIRYRATTYEVVSGDTGFRIGRKTGIPFYLIQQANPNLDWEATILSPGDIINLPTRDLTIPENPVPTKRIVVNLNTQQMIAFENGQPVFQWAISSGISSAPTSPGIYQILSQQEEASGSSFTLCGERGCGQWEMYWFMGVYEVVPGLMNGFHGAVLLPDGTYLGGGNVGAPFTFGCIMSENGNAEQLYRWAEIGTIVEIVSSEFAPVSALGQLAWEQTGGIG
jgi:lipoprotein-anchoring transpeptidase ErfK/SrfK